MRTTLSCIGDAVITTDSNGNVTLVNPVAQALTGWTQEESRGVPLARILTIVNEESRLPVESPAIRALQSGAVVGLANHTLLLAKDGTERAIDHSAAPIRNAVGKVAGVVMVFRDVTQRRQQEKLKQAALAYADNIIATLREPFAVLDKNLRVVTANASFYRTFHVSKNQTENYSLFVLGNGQWDNPRLRKLLGEILSDQHAVEDFQVEHDFPTIGRKTMLLNARRIVSQDGGSDLILLAIEDVTERKRVEEVLRQVEAASRISEIKYRRLFESAKDGILILDVNSGKITDSNLFMSELLGYERSYLLGKELWEIGFFKDISANKSAFLELQSKGFIRYDNRPLETHDKRKVDVEVVSNTYEVDGKLLIQCNVRDISQRRRIEEALRIGEVRYESLVRAIAQIVWTTDPSGERHFTSPRFCDYTGFTEEEVEGWGWINAVHPEDRETAAAAWRGFTSTKLPACFNYRLKRADGQWRHMLVRGIPILDQQGAVSEWIGVCLDETERCRAEESLRIRDRAIQAVSQGILITDPSQPDNPIIYTNPGFEHITGYRNDEVLGRNCRFLLGKNSDPATVQKIREAIRAQQECSVEILNYRKDGTPFWNALLVSPVRNEQGTTGYFVGSQTDITQRKILEEKLRQSQKMEAIGLLAGGVANDLNELLKIIFGHSETLLETLPAADPMRASVTPISEAGERAAALAEQLLAFSRKSVLEPKVLDLKIVVEETGKVLRRLIGDDVSLKIVLDPKLGPVKVDQGQLERVLMTLAVNARDAMPAGGKLSVECSNVEMDESDATGHPGLLPGHYVLVTVSDTGCGMTRQVKARIFEPFFTTKKVGNGTGIGLAVAFGIVEQSGGVIEVYSEPGVGSTFKIYLPRVDERIVNPKEPDGNKSLRETETVLLVENEDGVRKLALHVLQSYGYKVLSARTAKDALRMVEQLRGHIDVLVTDAVMPVMSGRELADALRPRFPKLKLLFFSGYTDDTVVRHGVLLKGVSYQQKPYSPLSLERKVREVLDKKD